MRHPFLKSYYRGKGAKSWEIEMTQGKVCWIDCDNKNLPVKVFKMIFLRVSNSTDNHRYSRTNKRNYRRGHPVANRKRSIYDCKTCVSFSFETAIVGLYTV